MTFEMRRPSEQVPFDYRLARGKGMSHANYCERVLPAEDTANAKALMQD